MNEIEIVINPYDSTTRININNRPISPYSELSKYLKEPFYTWCDKILDAISRELNDEFKLSITSRDSEAYILRGLSKNYEDCVEFKHNKLSIDMSIPDRLKKLSNIVPLNEIDIKNKDFRVNIFVTDSSAEEVINDNLKESSILEEQESGIFRAVNYYPYNINLAVKKYSENLFKQGIEDINFIVSLSKENAKLIYNEIKKYNIASFILVSNIEVGIESLNNMLICGYESSKFLTVLFELLEMRWITSVYSTLLGSIKDKISSDNNDSLIELKMMSSVEPFVTVSFNEQIEVNTFAPLIIKSYPDNIDLPQLEYRFSKEKIVSFDGKNILALAVGDVDVEVYIKGSLEPISKFHINVIQRKKIKKIELDKESYIMGIQDVMKLSHTFWPEDADNQSDLKWTSSDSDVATVDNNGNVVAIKPGTCYIKLSTEDVLKSCLISVKPKISNIKLSKQDINLYIGETTELNVEFFPIDVINNEIFWETNDKNVAIFENGTVKATGIGKGVITFYTADRSVSSSCQISVKSTFEKKEYKNISLNTSIIVFILSILLSGINLINIIIPIIGVLFGVMAIKYNKKDIGTATLFIVLNLVIFTVIFFDLFNLY